MRYCHGDPIRIGYVGAPGAASAAISLFVPGSNNPYALLATDQLYITSLLCEANGVADLLSVPAGAVAASSSTLLGMFLSTGTWYDHGTEALNGPQGVTPSIFTPVNGTQVNLSGTGFVIHGGPTGQLFPPAASPVIPSLPAFTINALGTLRSDFAGFLGGQFVTGAAPITVTAIGRMCETGNTQTHTVQIGSSATIASGIVATVQVDTTQGTPGTMQYVTLATPVVLAANTAYYLGSMENMGGDQWRDQASASPAVNFDPSSPHTIFQSGTTYSVGGSANLIYVPVNFFYHL